MKRPGATSNARRIRIQHGMPPSSKCADTRYTFSLPVSEVVRATNPAVFVKYADLSEYGYGVAILSESKYGFSCQGNVLRISLLRAATAPDAEQDQGSSCLWDDDGCRLDRDGKLLLFSTQASMNSRGLYCPTVDTSSNRTSPSQLISSTPRYMVSSTLLAD